MLINVDPLIKCSSGDEPKSSSVDQHYCSHASYDKERLTLIKVDQFKLTLKGVDQLSIKLKC